MKADKDRPSTWRPFRPSHCSSCWATCCTMPLEVKIEDLIRLEIVYEDEAHDLSRKALQRIAKRLLKEKWIRSYRESTGLFLIESLPNGDCRFLDGERRCRVYDKRPEVCRRFPESMGRRLGHCPFILKTRSTF